MTTVGAVKLSAAAALGAQWQLQHAMLAAHALQGSEFAQRPCCYRAVRTVTAGIDTMLSMAGAR